MVSLVEQVKGVASNASESIGQIAAVAEQNSAATEQVSASAEQMSAQVEQVSAAAHQLGELSDGLRNQVETFRLPGTASGDSGLAPA